MGEHTLSTVFSESVNTSADQLQTFTMRPLLLVVVVMLVVVAPAVDATTCEVGEDPTWFGDGPDRECTCVTSEFSGAFDATLCWTNATYTCTFRGEDPGCVGPNGVEI